MRPAVKRKMFLPYADRALSETWQRCQRSQLKPDFHPNAIACVRKQPIMVATASTVHPIGCKQQPIGCTVEAFSPVPIQTQHTQCTQRKRLHLDGNRALDGEYRNRCRESELGVSVTYV